MEETQEYDHMTKTSFQINGKRRTEGDRTAGGMLRSAAGRVRSVKTAGEDNQHSYLSVRF